MAPGQGTVARPCHIRLSLRGGGTLPHSRAPQVGVAVPWRRCLFREAYLMMELPKRHATWLCGQPVRTHFGVAAHVGRTSPGPGPPCLCRSARSILRNIPSVHTRRYPRVGCWLATVDRRLSGPDAESEVGIDRPPAMPVSDPIERNGAMEQSHSVGRAADTNRHAITSRPDHVAAATRNAHLGLWRMLGARCGRVDPCRLPQVSRVKHAQSAGPISWIPAITASPCLGGMHAAQTSSAPSGIVGRRRRQARNRRTGATCASAKRTRSISDSRCR